MTKRLAPIPDARPLILFLILTAAVAQAQDSQARGREVAAEAIDRDSGWGSYAADMTMILRNQAGSETERALRGRFLEIDGDGDKSLIVFDTPPDVKGTALLTHAHLSGDDDQWLYLPALERVKRIASSNKSGPFMGSEFSYEDMVPQELDKYTYDYLRDEPYDGIACYVIERTPVDKNSGYSRQVVWLDEEHYRMQKIEYYDRKNELMKTLTAHEYQLHDDEFWRAHRLEMVNHQTGKSTTMAWHDFDFETDFSNRDFDRNSLARIR
jgi:outer membrane lipoprotein-sorting protein